MAGPDQKGYKCLTVVRFLLSIFFVIVVGVVAVVDYNRFHGYCSDRSFNDSVGPPPAAFHRSNCHLDVDKRRQLKTPGKLLGAVPLKNWSRSIPAWGAVGIVYCISAIVNFVLICKTNPTWKSQKNPTGKNQTNLTWESETKPSNTKPVFSHDISEHWRVGWILFGCTVLIVVYYTVTIGMIITCRDGKEQIFEALYGAVIGVDVVLQGKHVLFASLHLSLSQICLWYRCM
jgi:hypothetical protein